MAPPTSGSTSSGPSTRDRLIRAALQAFSESGYSATSTKEIAELAGFAEKTLFSHFPSKNELFSEVIRQATAELLEPLLIDEVLDVVEHSDAESFRTVLHEVARRRVEFACRNPAGAKLLAQEMVLNEAFRAQVVALWQERLVPPVKAQLALARKAGEIRGDLDDDTILAATLGVVATQALTAALTEATEVDSTRLAKVIDLLVDGLSPRSTASPARSRTRRRGT